MTRAKSIVAGASVLLALATADAIAEVKVYAGSTDDGGEIALDVKVREGSPQAVTEIRAVDLPTICQISGALPSFTTFPAAIKVSKRLRFEAEFTQPDFGNVSTIDGKFKGPKHKRVEGDFLFDYHFPAEDELPTEDCATDVLSYSARRGAPDVDPPEYLGAPIRR